MSKVAFLFPGQGAQSVGMGGELIESVPAARALFDRASQILGYNLAELCLSGPADRLNSTECSQPALFVTSLAALESLRVESPDIVSSCRVAAGLSLGEYTALTFAGALDFEAGLRLVQARGKAMQEAAEANPGGMVSILGLDTRQVEDLCAQARADETLEIANLLCPGNTAVSGAQAACERITKLAEEAGAMKVVPLAVAGAFHTSFMALAERTLMAALEHAPVRAPAVPVISNVDAEPHEDPDEIRQMLVQQLVRPVLWEASMRRLLDHGFDEFFELGPGRVLRGLLRRIRRKTVCHCVES